MKANELMIGDWVKIKDLKDPIKQITCIDEYLGAVDFWDDEKLIITSIDNVLPIPLNADIVNQIHCHPKMAIFWDDRRTKETSENWYELRICTDGDTALNMEIRYVHELQHALRLLGIEKEIEL